MSIPVIASGGVGNLQHLVDGVIMGGADARAGGKHLSLRRARWVKGER